MARRMGEFDWGATPLGSPDSWPQSLQTAVRILLTSRYPMWMAWGPELIFLYNDAYKQTLGVKHPGALGMPIQRVWAEIWHDIGPRIQTVMETGTATWDEGLLLFLERSGYPEETYHTFSYSPLTEDDGTVHGTLCVVTEETERVIGERRLASLQELSSSLATTTRELDALTTIKRVLAGCSKDLAFTLIYLFQNAGNSARLAARTGLPFDHPAAPRLLKVANHPVWPAGALFQGNRPIVVDDLAAQFHDVPGGAWKKPARRALLVPIAQQGQTHPAGFLVAGLNPFRRLDAAYAGFIDLIAGQVAASLANARAAEAEEAQRRLQSQRDVLLARLQLQFERMPIACMLLDRHHRILEWNPAATTTFGYERDEAIGRDSMFLVPPAMQPNVQEVIDRLAAGDMSAHSVNDNLTKDGRTITCEWQNTPLRNSAGEVIGILSMVQDITERKQAEEALRKSEERCRSLIGQVRELAIFSSDEHGMVRTWNEGCQYVLGYAEEEFIGLDTAELFTAEDRAQDVPAAELRQAREAGTVGSERWMMARGGRKFFAMASTAALRDPAGRVIGFSTVLRDVTQMKEFQDELAQRGANLERLVSERTGELEETTERLRISERMAALGTLAAGLGHDMGNLLLPMDVRLGLLVEADLPRELHEHVMGIQKCARYLQRLSSGLRLLATDPSHVESRGATDLGRWWSDVRIILKDVLPAGIRFEHQLPESETWVALGRTGLTQAVYNLVQNAADALREYGGSRLSVGVENDPSVPWITIRVADDGPGMTEEVARRCREPYFSTKGRGESTGMGLALVHALITGAGGQLEIQSAPGRGTTMSLFLPRALPKESPASSSGMAGAV